MITVGEVAQWILENRTSTSFKGYNLDKVILSLHRHIKNQSMLLHRDENARVTGIVTWTLFPDTNVLYVHDILTIRPGIVKEMVKTCLRLFPGYTIQGKHRTGRQRHFKRVQTLANRL